MIDPVECIVSNADFAVMFITMFSCLALLFLFFLIGDKVGMSDERLLRLFSYIVSFCVLNGVAMIWYYLLMG